MRSNNSIRVTLYKPHNNQPICRNSYYRFISFIIPFIGCVIHFYTAIADYTTFGVVSEINIQNAEMIKLPAITICFHLRSAINFTRLTGNVKEPKIIDSILMSKTYKEINDSLNFNQSLIRTKRLISPHDYYDLNTSLAETMYYKERYICQTLNPRNGQEFVYKRTEFRKKNTYKFGIMVVLALKRLKELGNNIIKIALHTPQTKLHGFSNRYLQLNLNDINVIYLSYKIIENKLLPWPYESNCQEYGSTEARSKIFEDCENRQYRRLLNTTSVKAVVDLRTYSNVKHNSLLKFVTNSKKLSNAKRMYWFRKSSSIHEKCGSKAKKAQCVQIYYSPYVFARAWNNDKISAEASLVLTIPMEPIVQNIKIPKITFWQFVLFAGSISSFWFGVYVSQIVYGIMIYIPNYVNCAPLQKFM